MKIMTLCTRWATHTQYILDNDKADAAYKAIREAMDSYNPYANDKGHAVTVETGGGDSATFKIEQLVTVTLDDCAVAEATIIEREVWSQTIKSKVAARLAPAAS